MSRHAPRTFRLALYGRSDSGKTCILAALAMPLAPHPRGTTCTRLYPDPTSGKTRHAAQVAGYEWVEAAIGQIKEGKMPELNPQERPAGRVLRYGFTAEDVPEFRVELFDYTGELVNPLEHKDPKKLASVLLKHLRTIDGLLMLVEAPRGGGYDSTQASEIRLLAEAFAELKTDREVPIALLITKWDRCSDLKDAALKDESDRLTAFLNSGAVPELSKLRDAIRNTAGAANTRAFAVSAFGGHVQRDGHDYPADGALQAFGLECPFIWVAARGDAHDLHALDREVEAMRSFWGWSDPRSWSRAVWNRHAHLPNRFHPGSIEHTAVEKLFRQRRVPVLVLRGVAALLAILVVLGVEAGFDSKNYSRVGLAELPGASVSAIDAAIAWLERYSTSHPLRHTFFNGYALTRSHARAKIRDFEERIERQMWEPVERMKPDVLQQLNPAEDYLSKFPQGPHAAEAKTILEVAKAVRARRENDDSLDRLDHVIKALPSDAGVEMLKDVLATAEAPLPEPRWGTEGQLQRRHASVEIVRNRLEEVVKNLDWGRFLKTYEEHIAKFRLLAAARLLHQRQPVDDKLHALRTRFQTEASKLIQSKVDGLTSGNTLWAEAYVFLDEYDHWPIEMQSNELKKSTKAARKAVEQRHDQWLYGEVVKKRQDKPINDYLSQAPIHSMEHEVDQYKAYLARRRGKLGLTLILTQINWAEQCWNNNYNVVTVLVNGRKAIEKTGVVSRYLTSTGGFDPYNFDHNLDEPIKIEIKIVNDDYPISGGGDHDHGEAVGTERIEDLARGQGLTFPMRFDHGVNKARFVVTGLPEEPSLPPWRPRP